VEANAPRQHHNVTLAILTSAGIAFSLQQTMVIPALPALQRDLHATTGWATWIFTGFLLTASVTTPLLGKLGDQYGKERMLLVSLLVFFAGCAGAAAAWDIWSLIVFRMIQGAGGAIFPLSFAIIKDEFPPEKVGLGVGLVSSVLAVGGGLGLVLSGVIVDNLSWRFLFVVGAAPVALAAVLVHRYIPESPIKTPSRLDAPGAALLGAGLVCLLVGLTEGESWGWSSGRIVLLFGAAAIFLLAWALVELRVPEPLVDMRMLARRPVLMTNLVALLAGFALYGAFVLVPNFSETPRGLQAALKRVVDYGFGASPTHAGLLLVPGTVTGFVSGPVAGILGRRLGSKWPLALGMLLGSAGIAAMAVWHDRSWQIALGMVVLGAGLPMTFAAMAKLIVDAVRPSETGVATGVNTVMRTIGGVVGGQAGAAILATDTIGGTPVPAQSAFVAAFWMSAVAALAAVGIAIFATPLRAQPRLAAAEAG
jgi:EmrB/QacA subfamily drug resistance transporter